MYSRILVSIVPIIIILFFIYVIFTEGDSFHAIQGIVLLVGLIAFIIKWIINGKSYYKQEDNSQPAEISQPENENRQPDVSSSFIKTLLVTITLIILLLLGILLS